jgi:hypothetical protein
MKKVFIVILGLFSFVSITLSADIISLMPPNPTITTNRIRITKSVSAVAPPLAFYDDFSTNTGSWQFKDGTWVITNGVLSGTATTGGSYAFITNTFANVFIEARMRFVGVNQWGMALVSRYWPNTGANIAEWVYTSQVKSTIERYNDWYNLWTAIASKANPNPGTNWHLLQFSVSNNTYQTFYDSNLVNSVTDNTSTNSSGGVGFSLWASGGPTTIEVDYISVSTNFAVPPAQPPVFTSTPKNLVSTQGLSATLTANLTGTAPLSYQWYFGSSKVVGATSSAFTITNVQPSTQGNYSIVVTNAGGSTNAFCNLTALSTNVLTNCFVVSNKNWATISWCTVPDIDGYYLYYGVGNVTNWDGDCVSFSNGPCSVVYCGTNLFRAYTNKIDGSLQTQLTISNLLSNTKYYFATTSYSNSSPVKLESDFSAEVVYSTLTTNLVHTIQDVILSIQPIIPANTPRIMCKICPNTAISIQKSSSVLGPWNVWTNPVSDVYGNILVDDVSGDTQSFYRAKQL